ncbi:MAG TPA: hypothetical protein VHJ19_01015, partial [Gammaproteobacteria bacterium]|nr:hypothetical protein [Gammaproteobacteria bacterium]
GLLVASANVEQYRLCRVFGPTVQSPPVWKGGHVLTDARPVQSPLFTFVHYDVELDQDSPDELGLADILASDVQRIDDVDHLPQLERIGRAVAERQVRQEYFDRF